MRCRCSLLLVVLDCSLDRILSKHCTSLRERDVRRLKEVVCGNRSG
jgi:hypothetical protein